MALEPIKHSILRTYFVVNEPYSLANLVTINSLL